MTPSPIRVLLDQNFPVVPKGMRVELLDRTVIYEHFSVVAADHAKVSTPDWMVYLLAVDLGFTALVTSDHHQLEQDLELVTLHLTGLNLITWRGRQDDAVVMWGQLLAYMPQVVPQLKRGTIVRLPGARLDAKKNVENARALSGSRKAADGTSWPERRDTALRDMRAELDRRNAANLARHFEET